VGLGEDGEVAWVGAGVDSGEGADLPGTVEDLTPVVDGGQTDRFDAVGEQDEPDLIVGIALVQITQQRPP
jgi:hypothetical protein